MFVSINMPSCCVPGCSNRTRKGKCYMARLPNDPERKKIWMNNIGNINLEGKNDLRVCEVSNENYVFYVKYQNVIKNYIKNFYRYILQMRCGKINKSMGNKS